MVTLQRSTMVCADKSILLGMENQINFRRHTLLACTRTFCTHVVQFKMGLLFVLFLFVYLGSTHIYYKQRTMVSATVPCAHNCNFVWIPPLLRWRSKLVLVPQNLVRVLDSYASSYQLSFLFL